MKDLIFLISLVVFFSMISVFQSRSTADLFHRQLVERNEMTRRHLQESGINSTQTDTILSASDSFARSAYWASQSSINFSSTMAMMLIFILFWQNLSLRKAIKEMKNQLQLNKENA